VRPALEFAAALQEPPREKLAPYLRMLSELLEEVVALKLGFFKGAKVPPDELGQLVEEARRLAEGAFEKALRVRPPQVLRWVERLNDLQKPSTIDFDAWAAKARAAPAGAPNLPAPDPELEAAIELLRTSFPQSLRLPPAGDVLEELLENQELPGALISLYQVADGLHLVLGKYDLEIPRLHHISPHLSPVVLSHLPQSRNPWRYHYAFQPDGSVCEIEWWREHQRHPVEPPRRVARSLPELLRLTIAPERFDEEGAWTPGPLLPETGRSRGGSKSNTKSPKASDPSRGPERQPPQEIRTQFERIISSRVLRNPLTFFHSMELPTEEDIDALRSRLQVALPDDYVEFLRTYGAGRVEAKPEVWPPPEAGDVGEPWTTENAVTFCGAGRDVPESDQVLAVAERFWKDNEDDEALSGLVPFSWVELRGDFYCFNAVGEVVLVRKGESRAEPVKGGFLEIFEKEIEALIDRTNRRARLAFDDFF
jgi:hypothetical protein